MTSIDNGDRMSFLRFDVDLWWALLGEFQVRAWTFGSVMLSLAVPGAVTEVSFNMTLGRLGRTGNISQMAASTLRILSFFEPWQPCDLL
jgi:hypothetical protein